MRGLEAFAGDIFLEVSIGATVKNGVTFSFAVKLDKKFEVINLFRQLMLLMSEAEFFSPKPADFLVATEQEPRLDFGKAVDFDDSKTTASVIATNSLRRHKNIFISRKADVANGLFVNCV